jgi:hypothetical protein
MNCTPYQRRDQEPQTSRRSSREPGPAASRVFTGIYGSGRLWTFRDDLRYALQHVLRVPLLHAAHKHVTAPKYLDQHMAS